jgi:hypothetical protein
MAGHPFGFDLVALATNGCANELGFQVCRDWSPLSKVV